MHSCEKCGASLEKETSICAQCRIELQSNSTIAKPKTLFTRQRFIGYVIFLLAAWFYLIYIIITKDTNIWSGPIFIWLNLFSIWSKKGTGNIYRDFTLKDLYIFIIFIAFISALIYFNNEIKAVIDHSITNSLLLVIIGAYLWHNIYNTWLEFKSNNAFEQDAKKHRAS